MLIENVQEIQAIAEDKISCVCGNKDWRNFLYVQGGADSILAGCKKCGITHKHIDSAWVAISPSFKEKGYKTEEDLLGRK